ncbi:MAG: hypothetical protein M3367_00090 [Acidobacteriota bacterium]|nr:hypothetical protein [Acidobacteriota bacterium]
MAEAVPYNYKKPFVDILNVRTFSASEGRSVELSKIAEQAMREAVKARHSAFEEKQQQTESLLLVFLAELDDESDYNEEFLKPSKFATNAARNVLLQAYRGLSNFSLLPTFVTADGDGGIRILWQNEAKELRLLCSDEGTLKLYWQDGKNYGLEESEITNLISRFEWLKEA